MRNRKLFKSAIIITALTLSMCGCGKQAEPVSAEPTETVSEEKQAESVESSESMESSESSESKEPTPSPTVEPTEKPVEESVESTENEESTSEVEKSPEEESSEESTGIEIVEELDLQMYVQTSANARSGDSTDFEVVTTFSTNTQVHVTGKTANDWFRVEQSEGDVYISGKLLGMEKAVVQQSSGGGSGQQSNGGNGGNSGAGNGGSGNTQTPTPPPAESQQPSSNDDEGAVAGDVVNGIVVEDAGSMDWTPGSAGEEGWH
jgi:hypothetical protein